MLLSQNERLLQKIAPICLTISDFESNNYSKDNQSGLIFEHYLEIAAV